MADKTSIRDYALGAQKIEITEYQIFSHLAKIKSKNQHTLQKLSVGSFTHYQYWKNTTGKEVGEDKVKVWLYYFLAKLFGLTFVIKMLERQEVMIESFYERVSLIDKKYVWIYKEEKEHEKLLIGLIDEDFLKYVSSIVLGSSDALVELTGTLAGLTFTLQDHRLIGMSGLITGIAASLSMASSEYLSTKSETGPKKPIKAAMVTGFTYVSTTAILIFPYFVLQNYILSLLWTMFNVLLVILFSSFYLSVTREESFLRKFIESGSLSFGVAILSFAIGLLVHQFLHLDI